MLKQEIAEIVDISYKKLKNKNIDWVIVGTASLALQGMDLRPADIDIFTTKNGAFEIFDALKEYGVQEIGHSVGPAGTLYSWFGKLKINDLIVEINGDPESRSRDGGWIKSKALSRKGYIRINNHEIPILPIKAELEEVENPEKLKREKDLRKIQLIKEYLNDN